MGKFMRSDWFLLKLRSEIAKLKDIEILSCAESVEILFNGPRGVLKEFAGEMNSRDLGQPGTRFSPEKYIRRVYDGVLIFPIKGDEPIIIFKQFGHGLSQFRVYIDLPNFDEAMPFSSTYIIYWKGEFRKDWPPAFKKQYSKTFVSNLMYAGCLKPIGGIELPLKLILDEEHLKIFDPTFIKPIKNALRKIKVLDEKRGKLKHKDKDIRKLRDKILILNFREMGSPDRLPIKKLKRMWEDKVNTLFPEDSSRAEECNCDDMTIRRVLQNYKEERKALKEIREWQKCAPDFKKLDKEFERDMKKDPRFAHNKNVKLRT